MSESQLEAIALWIVIPASIVLVTLALVTVIGVPSGVIERRKRQQLDILSSAAGTAQEMLEIDWIRYKYMSHSFVLDVLQERGWGYVDQVIDDNSWLLRFSRLTQSPGRPGPDSRLRSELANATLDSQGRYRVDLTNYEILTRADLERIIRSSGWKDKLWLSTIVQVAPE